MNTVRSFWLGWGSLCVGAGVAYVFAKKSINADRQARLNEQRRKRSVMEQIEQSNPVNGGPPRTDLVGSPSQETGIDPAPTRHAPATEEQRVFEKSKYEASAPYKSTKGDRFS